MIDILRLLLDGDGDDKRAERGAGAWDEPSRRFSQERFPLVLGRAFNWQAPSTTRSPFLDRSRVTCHNRLEEVQRW